MPLGRFHLCFQIASLRSQSIRIANYTIDLAFPSQENTDLTQLPQLLQQMITLGRMAGALLQGVCSTYKGLPTVGVAIQDYLTEEDVHKMARLATSERNRLLVLTLFYSVLRINEALSLTPGNLLIAESHLKLIQPKTQHAHEVGIPRWLTNELTAYIKANGIGSNKPIFDISAVTAWGIVKSYGHKIGKNISILTFSDIVEPLIWQEN